MLPLVSVVASSQNMDLTGQVNQAVADQFSPPVGRLARPYPRDSRKRRWSGTHARSRRKRDQKK